MTAGSQRLGARGELLAARWYEERGWLVLDRNWRCREGEIDLVLSRDGTVVFCEVKTRSSHAFGSPAEAVTLAKQRRLRTLARRWMAVHAQTGVKVVRFDVAAVVGLEVQVIADAF